MIVQALLWINFRNNWGAQGDLNTDSSNDEKVFIDGLIMAYLYTSDGYTEMIDRHSTPGNAKLNDMPLLELFSWMGVSIFI